MPRKKPLPKYVVLKCGCGDCKEKKRKPAKCPEPQWHVRKHVPGLKYPVWRICKDQTQDGVDEVLKEIKADFEAALAEPVEEEPEQVTVNELFDEWLASIDETLAPRTIADYTEILARYFRPKIGLLLADQLTEKDLKAIFDSMKAAGLSTRTRRYAYTVVSKALKDALKWKLIAENPTAEIRMPRLKQAEVVVLNREEAKRLFAACNGEKHGLIFQFALETGMRPEEYLALQWNDIDFTALTAQVKRTVVFHRKGGGWSFELVKTKKSRRAVNFSESMRDKLTKHREDQEKLLESMAAMESVEQAAADPNKTTRQARREREARLRAAAMENHRKYNLVFPGQDFTPITVNNLGRRYLDPILNKLNINKRITPKALRHTCATLMLLGGVNPKIVSERLGHASIVVTLEIYSHILPTMQDAATNILSAMLTDSKIQIAR